MKKLIYTVGAPRTIPDATFGNSTWRTYGIFEFWEHAIGYGVPCAKFDGNSYFCIRIGVGEADLEIFILLFYMNMFFE